MKASLATSDNTKNDLVALSSLLTVDSSNVVIE
jgi:hypothetical protein